VKDVGVSIEKCLNFHRLLTSATYSKFDNKHGKYTLLMGYKLTTKL